MPELSRFLGIIIFMNWVDHPLPHFHARYGDYEITVEIQTGVVRGTFPKRALRATLEWLDLHQAELMEDWQLAQTRKPLKPIAPLE
ncbi:DUF4160 domain-containing protein [Sulfuriferula nivalis]|uniref:Transcriptional regulator n=1 Tax=Sulfuriferula nivalis TaxID=2675298 RepID=A0A809SDQ2_9PROT|nr:DUF4160 domain-containing protein [Sulfuriferula nivalis]BBP00757.1 hypothetical protein SFSGTM_14650 [Sulfuriferula nivalis]